MDRIGVIGLGRMGSAIARRMMGEGCHVTGWTRSGTAVADVPSAPDLVSLVAGCDVLILSLFDDAAVAQVLDALLETDVAGKLIIETSTVVPTVIKDREQAILAKGAMVVDAPIAGGPDLVRAGTCGVYLGGDVDAATRALACLAPLTGRVFHMGPLGAGLVMKTINNGMMQVYAQGLAELLPLAKRANLSLGRALEVLCAGPAGMPMVTTRLPKVLGDDTTVGFSIAAVQKDNAVCRQVLQGYDLTSQILEMHAAVLQQQIAEGVGDLDAALVISSAYAKG